MLAKKPLAIAVAAGLATIGAASTVSASSAFFQYLALGSDVTTVVSVINTSDALYQRSGAQILPQSRDGYGFLHYRFYYKTTGAAGNVSEREKPCTEYNVHLPTSLNDIVTFDTGSKFAGFNGTGVLFEDLSVSTNPLINAADKWNFAKALVTPNQGVRAYLLVDNADSSSESASSIVGDALIIDFGAGAAWGYGANTIAGESGQLGPEFWYLNPATAVPNPTRVSLLPLDKFKTAFFVTPLSRAGGFTGLPPINGATNTVAFTTDTGQAPAGTNTYQASVTFSTVTTDGGGYNGYALYDRDENPVSGAKIVPVVCVGRVEAQDMLDSISASRLVNGGFGNLVNMRTKATGANVHEMFNADNPTYSTGGAAIAKLEYNLTGDFDGVPVAAGLFNNGYKLNPEQIVKPGNPITP